MQTNDPVAAGLHSVLQTSYSLFLVEHNYHWNIEGSKFVSLHALFEEQYNELFQAIDAVAERMRALDSYASAFDDGTVMTAMSKLPNPLEEVKSAEKRATMMVQNLIKLNDVVIDACKDAKDAASEANDNETEDLLIGRITTHQQNNWMLKSVIKE
ncbi:MAG: DNA starvation/stationary phase protection protein [Pseudomonadota bacterium]